MRGKRLWITLRLWTIRSSVKRACFLKKCNVFASMGDGCSVQQRTLPLYPNLIRIGNNVHIASNVGFLTHDVTHLMLNKSDTAKSLSGGHYFQEKLQCIQIGDNVFIGAGSRILYDVRIGSNVVIGAGAIVSRDIPDNSVAAGIPAKVIGSFEDFVQKRAQETNYPRSLLPRHEEISEKLATILWKDFDEQRKTE